jgi:hypothetical protein
MLLDDTKRKEGVYPSRLSGLRGQLGKILATHPGNLENRGREHFRKQGNLSLFRHEGLPGQSRQNGEENNEVKLSQP